MSLRFPKINLSGENKPIGNPIYPVFNHNVSPNVVTAYPRTIANNLVTVQPMSAPSWNPLIFGPGFHYSEEYYMLYTLGKYSERFSSFCFDDIISVSPNTSEPLLNKIKVK